MQDHPVGTGVGRCVAYFQYVDQAIGRCFGQGVQAVGEAARTAFGYEHRIEGVKKELHAGIQIEWLYREAQAGHAVEHPVHTVGRGPCPAGEIHAVHGAVAGCFVEGADRGDIVPGQARAGRVGQLTPGEAVDEHFIGERGLCCKPQKTD